jgi:hypothetical protein
LTTLPPSCANYLKIWESHPPGTLRTCPGLYRDCFIFIYTIRKCNVNEAKTLTDLSMMHLCKCPGFHDSDYSDCLPVYFSSLLRTPSRSVQQDARTWDDAPLNTTDHHAYTPPPLTTPRYSALKKMCFLYTLYILYLLCFMVFIGFIFYVFLNNLYKYSSCNTIQA